MRLRCLTLNCWGLPDVVTRRVYAKLHAVDAERASGGTGGDGGEEKGTTPRIASRTERITAIVRAIEAGFDGGAEDFDIVAFQELWLPQDREVVLKTRLRSSGRGEKEGDKEGAGDRWYSSHTFDSGILGSSGLVILSRYPIVAATFHRYRVNGQVTRVDEME
jgi:Endonuclease/Exonuclease/phosphatase family